MQCYVERAKSPVSHPGAPCILSPQLQMPFYKLSFFPGTVEHFLEIDGGVQFGTQSRQSAKRFSSRWNWDSPTPLAVCELSGGVC